MAPIAEGRGQSKTFRLEWGKRRNAAGGIHLGDGTERRSTDRIIHRGGRRANGTRRPEEEIERERVKREEGKKIGVENDSQKERRGAGNPLLRSLGRKTRRDRRVPLLVPMRTRVESLQGVHLAICDNVRREASQRVGENLPTVSLCMCILRTSVSIQRGKGFQEQWG